MTERSLGLSAADFYVQAQGKRTGVVNMGRRLADLTIPSTFPAEDYDTSHDSLPITNQSINAHLVNNLANTLTMVAFPPDLPMLEFTPNESQLRPHIEGDPEYWSEIEYALSRKEEQHRKKLNTTRVRDRYTATMKQLITSTGNACILWTDIANPIVFNLHSFVVKRDSRGVPLVTVIKECISTRTADEDVKAAVQRDRIRKGKPFDPNDWNDTADIYHVQKLVVEPPKQPEWLYWQETEGGHVIEDTDFWSDYDTPAIFPAGMIFETGSDYALPYSLDYEGDLKATEELSASFQDGAASLAWFLIFVNPTGNTKIKAVREADNLDVIPGHADDVTTLDTGKGGDIMRLGDYLETIARRLAIAYANEAGIQRNGERVTAEEWRRMAMALDKGMGGLYAAISQTVQRWFVLRFLFLHHKADKSLKALPKEFFEVEVATGIDNIGRSSEYDNLMTWGQDMAGLFTPQVFAQEVNMGAFLRATGGARALKVDALVKSPEQKETETQNNEAAMQQQALLEKGTAPVAKGGMDMLAAMTQQQGGPVDG